MKRAAQRKKTATAARLESGALLVEFVLVAPFVLFLLGYILRLTLQLQAHQIAMNISREVATDIFRKCADFAFLNDNTEPPTVNEGDSRTAITNCLTTARTKVRDQWDSIKPLATVTTRNNLRLDLAVYRHGLGNLAACQDCTQCGSRDTTTVSVGNTPPTLPNSTVCPRNRIVRVFVSFEIKPIDAFINLISSATGLSNNITIQEEAII